MTPTDPAKRFSLLSAVLEAVARCDSILEQESFDTFSAKLCEAIGFRGAGISISDGPKGYRFLVSSGPNVSVFAQNVRQVGTRGAYERLYHHREPFLIENLENAEQHTSKESAMHAAGFRSFALFPIPGRDGATLATLYFGFATDDGARNVDRDFVARVTSALCPSVERGLSIQRDRRATRILEASHDAMLAWDGDGTIADLNEAAAYLVGGAREEIVGLSVVRILGCVPEPGPSLRLELAPLRGRTVVVSATVSAVSGDPVVVAHALLRDLTEVISAEREAAASMQRLREVTEQHAVLLDNAPLVIFRLDPKTHELLYLNRHAERLFGAPAHIALSTPAFLRKLHIDPEGAQAFEDAVRTAARGEPSASYEARLGLAGSLPITARGNVYPILAASGKVAGIEGILLDVTSERAARSRLVQADRLATVGTLAAGVAHEINNPAAFMLLGLDALSRQLTGPNVTMTPPAKEIVLQLVEDLRETGRRIVEIARDMRMFASPPSAEIGRPIAVDVARAIESALTITRAQIVEKADIELDLAPDTPAIAMDEGRLGQVMVNLLVNAAQTLEAARSSRVEPLTDDKVRVSMRHEGGQVTIEVEDTGIGIAEPNLSRIFTPFFTTKGPDHGTGLGLAISKAIIERAGGSIEAHSPSSLGEPRRGARFVICLPALDSAILPAATTPPEPPRKRLRARVLIVEDEVLLGRALGDQIGEHHDVRVAPNGLDALTVLEKDRFDVVLCDLKMPGLSGEGLYREVARRDPDQAKRFVFMTGIGFGLETERFIEEVGTTLLEKPFSIEKALIAIGKVAEGQQARAAR